MLGCKKRAPRICVFFNLSRPLNSPFAPVIFALVVAFCVSLAAFSATCAHFQIAALLEELSVDEELRAELGVVAEVDGDDHSAGGGGHGLVDGEEAMR